MLLVRCPPGHRNDYNKLNLSLTKSYYRGDVVSNSVHWREGCGVRLMGEVSNDTRLGGAGFADATASRRVEDKNYAFVNGQRYAKPSADFSQGVEQFDSYWQGLGAGVGSSA